MRIISGVSRGIKIDTVNSGSIRPTTDKVKESVFNIIQFDIKDKNFLDLFGGTGQIGIEAASRGAKKTVIVDSCRDSIDVIKKNVGKSKLDSCIEVIRSDAVSYLNDATLTFDICFLDPPYSSNVLNKSLMKLFSRVDKSGIIITETPKEEEILKRVGNFELYKQYSYGEICINTYKDINF